MICIESFPFPRFGKQSLPDGIRPPTDVPEGFDLSTVDNVTMWQCDNVTMWQCHNVTINAKGFMKTCKRLSPKRTDSSVSSRPFLSRVLRRQLFNSVFTGFKLSNYFFCIKANSDVFIVQICTLDDFIISCIFCQSGHAVLFLLHNYLHPDNGRRLLRELQKEMLHRVHSDKVKPFANPKR